MNNIKRQFSPQFKSKIAVELIKEIDSITQICSANSIHPTQARRWKEHALLVLENAFDQSPDHSHKQQEELTDKLYQQIGQLKVELDWLKKKTNTS